MEVKEGFVCRKVYKGGRVIIPNEVVAMSGNARKPLEQSIPTHSGNSSAQVLTPLDHTRLCLADEARAWEKRAGRKLPSPGKH